MARIRSIKPDFWTDEKVVELSFPARLLFIGLWNFADDEGRMIFSPKKIKMQILPADNLDISELFGELRRESMITIYEVQKVEYLQLNNFVEHQKIDKRSASRLPPVPATLPESPRIPSPDRDRDRDMEEDREKETFQVSKKREDESYKMAFDEFWHQYPKQRAGSKDRAAKELYKAIERADGGFQAIMAGLLAYSQSDEVQRGYAKGAAAWLRDDRWTVNYSIKAKKGEQNVKPTWTQAGFITNERIVRGPSQRGAEAVHQPAPGSGVHGAGLLLEATGRPADDGGRILPLPKPIHS